MSKTTSGFGNNNQQITNFDLTKIFILNNRYQKDQYVNNSNYDPINIPIGTVMGRISATGVLVPWTSTASDGSQFPVGLMAQDVSVAGSATITATICDMGDVNASQIICAKPGDSLESIVSSRRLRDHLQSQGIKLVNTIEMTSEDNQ